MHGPVLLYISLMWWVLYKEMQPREGPPHFLQIKRWPFKIIKINCLQFPFKYSIMFIYEDRRWLFHRISFNPIIMCVDAFKQSILLGRAWVLVIGVQYSSMYDMFLYTCTYLMLDPTDKTSILSCGAAGQPILRSSSKKKIITKNSFI